VIDLNLQVLSVNPEDFYNLSDRSIRAANNVGDTADPILCIRSAALFYPRYSSWCCQRLDSSACVSNGCHALAYARLE